MAQRTKPTKVIIHKHTNTDLDIEALATIVAKTVAETLSKNLLDKLDKLQYSGEKKLTKDELQIVIDESIIPITVEATAEYTNLEGMAKEETLQDSELANSKTKLANLLKKKENK